MNERLLKVRRTNLSKGTENVCQNTESARCFGKKHTRDSFESSPRSNCQSGHYSPPKCSSTTPSSNFSANDRLKKYREKLYQRKNEIVKVHNVLNKTPKSSPSERIISLLGKHPLPHDKSIDKKGDSVGGKRRKIDEHSQKNNIKNYNSHLKQESILDNNIIVREDYNHNDGSDMDWSPIDQNEVVSNIQRLREDYKEDSYKIRNLNQLNVMPNVASITNANIENKTLYVVVDTNIFIGQLNIIQDMLSEKYVSTADCPSLYLLVVHNICPLFENDFGSCEAVSLLHSAILASSTLLSFKNATKYYMVSEIDKLTEVLVKRLKAPKTACNHVVYVPWIVIQELDYFKDGRSGSPVMLKAAKKAVTLINNNLNQKHPRLKGQTVKEELYQRESSSNPDDSILFCCLQLAQTSKSVVLLSNDVNLRNKALINSISSYGPKHILTSIKNFNISNGNKQKVYQISSTLSHLCTEIILAEMEEAYGSVLNQLIKEPPWDLKQCLVYIKRFWNPVFSLIITQKQCLKIIEDLLTKIQSSDGLNTEEDVEEFIKLCLSMCVYFKNCLNKHKKSVLSCISNIQKIVS